MNPYLALILAAVIGGCLLDLVVEWLNLRYLKAELPEEFKGWYDSERYRASQSYLEENTRFELVRGAFMTLVTVFFLLLGGFNGVDRLARGFGFGMIPTGLLFSFILLFASQLISIPFSVYDTFVIEEKFGFNRTTPKTFATDILKSWFLAVLIGGPVLAVILWFFHQAGSWAWVFCWMAVTLIQVLLMFIAPAVIMPLFNKFTPIEEGELKSEIEGYARSQGFRMKGLFTMDGSKRSSKANAFFTGFGRYRRIVLFDTLVGNHTVQELVSVLAHEMGHYKKRHVFKILGISVATTGVMLFVLSRFIDNAGLFKAFRMEQTSIYAGIVFFGFLYAPMEMVLSIFGNMLSRRYEYKADEFAARTYGKPRAMIDALKKLTVDNLSNLTPHPLKVFLDYSHPPVLRRIRALRDMKPRGDATGYRLKPPCPPARTS